MKIINENLRELTKVQLTNLDKIFYPEVKVSKGEVIEYYIKMAPKMLPIMADRPLVLTRSPTELRAISLVFLKKMLHKERPNGLKLKQFIPQRPT